MKKNILKCLTSVFLLLICATFFWWPKAGFVADEKNAVKIAEIEIIKKFGIKTFLEERPFKAVFKNGIWDVYPLAEPIKLEGDRITGGRFGGVQVKISQKDGLILGVWLGK